MSTFLHLRSKLPSYILLLCKRNSFTEAWCTFQACYSLEDQSISDNSSHKLSTSHLRLALFVWPIEFLFCNQILVLKCDILLIVYLHDSSCGWLQVIVDNFFFFNLVVMIIYSNFDFVIKFDFSTEVFSVHLKKTFVWTNKIWMSQIKCRPL